MAGLLDDIFGGSYSGDDTVKDQYGQTQADRRKPVFSGLVNAGLLAMAGGQNLMPADRAKYIAAAGGALGGIGPAMQDQQTQAAQNMLRSQQLKGEQIKTQQQQQIQAYIRTPEFQAALEKLSPAERAVVMGDALQGKFESFAKFTDPKRDWAKPQADGSVQLKDGSIINGLGQMVVGPGGKFIPPEQRGTQPPQAPAQPTVDPDVDSPDINKRTAAADKEIAGFSSYGTPQQPAPTPQAALFAPSKFSNLDMNVLKQIAQQYGPQVAQQVRDFAEYKTPFPISARTGAITNPNSTTAQMLGLVKQVNPDWTSADFTNRQKMVQEYLISGKAKNNLDALNTAYGHIGDLYDTFKALGTGNSQLANAAMNALSEKMGGAKIVDAETAGRAVAHELASVFRAQGMSVAEIQEWEKGLSPNMSPAQMQAAIERAVHLMQSRVDTHTKDWKNVMGNTPVQFFNPERIQKIEQIKANPIGGAPPTAAGAKPGQAPTGKTPDGKPVYTHSDGKQYLEPE